MLGTELTGDLRCARCRYNLRGLSVRGVCPECGTPVAATLLAVLDPQAAELQPIRLPRLTALGMVVWAGGAVGAGLLSWLVRLGEAFPSIGLVAWAPGAIFCCMVACAVGGVALIRPHRGIRKSAEVAAASACAGCIVLALLSWKILVEIDGIGGRPYFSGSEWSDRWAWKVAETVVIGLVILGFRPVFHVLQARSHLLRTGTLERQTLRAILASVAVVLVGDLVQAAFRALGMNSEIPPIIAMCVSGGGSLTLLLGLVGVLVDVRRLVPVVIATPLGLSDVLAREGEVAKAARAMSRAAAESAR